MGKFFSPAYLLAKGGWYRFAFSPKFVATSSKDMFDHIFAEIPSLHLCATQSSDRRNLPPSPFFLPAAVRRPPHRDWMSTKKRAPAPASKTWMQLRMRPQLSQPNAFYAAVPVLVATAALLAVATKFPAVLPPTPAPLPTAFVLDAWQQRASKVPPHLAASLASGQNETDAAASLEALALHWDTRAQAAGSTVKEPVVPRGGKYPSERTQKTRVKVARDILQSVEHGGHVHDNLPSEIVDLLVYSTAKDRLTPIGATFLQLVASASMAHVASLSPVRLPSSRTRGWPSAFFGRDRGTRRGAETLE